MAYHGFTSHNMYSNIYNKEPDDLPSGAWSDKRMIEDENDELTAQLRNKVKTLKSLSIDIGHEVRNQNRMLSDMDDDMAKGGNLLERTVRRLGGISRGLHNYHLLLLFVFVFLVFILLWLVLKFR